MSEESHLPATRRQISLLALIWLMAWFGVVVNLWWQMRYEYAGLFSLLVTVVMVDGFLLVRRSITRWRVKRLIIASASIGIALSIILADDLGAKEMVFQPLFNRKVNHTAVDLHRQLQTDASFANVKVNVVTFKGCSRVSVTGSVSDNESLYQLERLVAQSVPQRRLLWSVAIAVSP